MQKHIITACSGYRPNQLAPFFDGLEQIDYDGTVHALIWDDDRLLAAYLEQQNIKVSVVNIGRQPTRLVNRLARVLSLMPARCMMARCNTAAGSHYAPGILRWALPISSLRYIYAYNIVRQSTSDSVFLLTDSRDVYFQKCPFEDYAMRFPATLHLSMEDMLLQPGDCTYSWLVDIYGHKSVGKMCLGQHVSCSGTTMADKTRIESYLDEMVREIIKHRWGISHTVGYDQGLHNYLYYSGALSCVSNPANGDGIFWVSQGRPIIDHAGKVVSESGAIIPLVHQYDRNIAHYRGSALFESASRAQLV